MHDIRAIRDNRDAYVAGWTSRGVEDAAAVVDQILTLDRELRAAQTAGQDALSKRNAASKAIGAAMGRKDTAEAERLKAEVEGLKGEIAANEKAERIIKLKLLGPHGILMGLKNLAAEDVPDGEDEADNVEIDPALTRARLEAAKKVLPALRGNHSTDHADLGEAMGLLDFEAAAKMSGARFAVLKGGLARLERALGQFMLDMQTQAHGYQEVNPPYLVGEPAMYGTGQMPKFEDDLFELWMDYRKIESENNGLSALSNRMGAYARELGQLNEGAAQAMLRAKMAGHNTSWASSVFSDLGKTFGNYNRDFSEIVHQFDSILARLEEMGKAGGGKLYLIPTAEVSLTNLVRETILSEGELATPMRMTALTPCFRAEAGSAGRDTRGLIRQHQFSKVELVSITRPEDSEAEHERMTGCAEAVLQALELPYRRMLLCKGDMGFSARKTFDLEVWLPSQNTYREISSCSNCGDFQARRMDARFKRAGEKKTEFVHTLNGSGLAVGRTLVAIMENYQDQGGRIAVPSVLLPYMGGVTHVGA